MDKNPQHRYIATFPAGCYEVISRQLKSFKVDELRIETFDESSVSFASSLRPERLIEIRFFTNVYVIVDGDNLSSFKEYIKGNSFRLLALSDGEPTKIADSQRDALTKLIKKEFGIKANVERYSTDFVLIKRSEQAEVLTIRLPRAKFKREKLPQGALRPELANILLLVAGVKAKDVLLDPFAGYGSIPLEAKRGFGLKKVIAIEKNEGLVKDLAEFDFEVIKSDASDLAPISNNSIDKIVTDPPWGIYEEADNLEILYKDFLNSAWRVLKPKGILVVLSGSQVLDRIIEENRRFINLRTLNILVSGKKAKILKLQKL